MFPEASRSGADGRAFVLFRSFRETGPEQIADPLWFVKLAAAGQMLYIAVQNILRRGYEEHCQQSFQLQYYGKERKMNRRKR